MVADVISRTHSVKMYNIKWDEGISECYVEVVKNVFSTEEAPNTDNNPKLLAAGVPQRPMINDLLSKQCNSLLCSEYRTELYRSDSPYLVDEHGIL